MASKEKEDEFIDTASADTKKGSEKTTLRKGDPSKAAKSAGEKTFRHRTKFQAAIFKNHPITRVIKADTAPSVLFVQTIQTWYMDAILRMSHQ